MTRPTMCLLLLPVAAVLGVSCSRSNSNHEAATPATQQLEREPETTKVIDGTANRNAEAPSNSPNSNGAIAREDLPSQKSFAAWFAQGQTALDELDNEAALAAFIKALELDPLSSTAYNARGVAYLRMNKLSPALRDFSKAIELAPNTAKFYGNRAFVYSDKEEYARAIADLTKATQLEPKSPEWYRERAKVYLSVEDNRLAEIDFETAKRLDAGERNPQQAPPVVVQSQAKAGVASQPVKQDPRFDQLRALTEDIHEFTRLSDANTDDLKLLVAEYRTSLELIYANLDPSRRDATYSVYSQAQRMYDDSARVWEVHLKSAQILQKAKDKWRDDIKQRALLGGGKIDNTDLVDSITAFEFIIQKDHAPHTLYPPESRFVTGLGDIQQRYPELAGEFKGYSYVKSGSVAYLWQKAEATLAVFHPNWQVESTPPFLKSSSPRSARLVERTTGRRREQAEKIAAEKAQKFAEEKAVKAEQQKKDEAQRKAEEPAKREKAAASRLSLAKQFIDKDKLVDGKKRLQAIIDDYPETEAAKKAGVLLIKIK